MKESIIDSLDPRLKSHLCTLKKSSLDKENNIYMCSSLIKVVDYDAFPKIYSQGKGWSGVPKSNDALYIDENEEWHFIEFKNGKVEKDDIFRKIYDSIIMLIESGIFPNFDFVREKVNYILVYNSKKNGRVQDSESRDMVHNYTRRLANEEQKMFEIYKVEQYLFKETHTYTKELFEEIFVKRMEKEEGLTS